MGAPRFIDVVSTPIPDPELGGQTTVHGLS
jgi:hypothetical protein